jgi:hypothetical protein
VSGGDRKALDKELTKARGVTLMLARQAEELREKGEALIREADKLSCESWNERMWSVGEPIDPSPTVDQAPSTAAGCRSSARGARRRETWTWPRCRIRRRRVCTISPAGSGVRSALRPASVRWRPYCNSRKGRGMHPQNKPSASSQMRRSPSWNIEYADANAGYFQDPAIDTLPTSDFMHEYRVYTVDPDGHFQSCKVIEAAGDDAAVEAARKFVDGCGIEVWLLDRKVAILTPENTGS